MTAASGIAPRTSYLALQLEELASIAQGPKPQEARASLRIASRNIRVDGWEWDALVVWNRSREKDGWEALLAEGLAFEARCGEDLDRARQAIPTAKQELEAALSDLHFDAVLAYRLMRNLQRWVERTVILGRMDQAKKLTQFRHRINENLISIGECVGEGALREAEDLAAAAPEPSPMPERAPAAKPAPQPASVPLRDLLDMEDRLEKQVALAEAGLEPLRDAESRAENPPRVSPRLVLAGVLAVLCVVWFVVVGLPAASRRTLPAFSEADFAKLPVVEHVTARAPSLFVTLDEEGWQGLAEEDRRLLVEEVARIIEPAGYTGAHFAGPNGGTLATWLKQTGVRLRPAIRANQAS